jgi:hypothetical protein
VGTGLRPRSSTSLARRSYVESHIGSLMWSPGICGVVLASAVLALVPGLERLVESA